MQTVDTVVSMKRIHYLFKGQRATKKNNLLKQLIINKAVYKYATHNLI